MKNNETKMNISLRDMKQKCIHQLMKHINKH